MLHLANIIECNYKISNYPMEDEWPDWEPFHSWAEGVARHSANHHCYQNSIELNSVTTHVYTSHQQSKNFTGNRMYVLGHRFLSSDIILRIAFLMETSRPGCSRMLCCCSSFCWLAYRTPRRNQLLQSPTSPRFNSHIWRNLGHCTNHVNCSKCH